MQHATATGSEPRFDARLTWLFGLAAAVVALVVVAPKLGQGLFRFGIRTAIRLAILAAALGYASRFWPF